MFVTRSVLRSLRPIGAATLIVLLLLFGTGCKTQAPLPEEEMPSIETTCGTDDPNESVHGNSGYGNLVYGDLIIHDYTDRPEIMEYYRSLRFDGALFSDLTENTSTEQTLLSIIGSYPAASTSFGHRYQLNLDDGRQLMIQADHTGVITEIVYVEQGSDLWVD